MSSSGISGLLHDRLVVAEVVDIRRPDRERVDFSVELIVAVLKATGRKYLAVLEIARVERLDGLLSEEGHDVSAARVLENVGQPSAEHRGKCIDIGSPGGIGQIHLDIRIRLHEGLHVRGPDAPFLVLGSGREELDRHSLGRV